MKRIYLSPPDVGLRERQLLLDAFHSNWIAPLGPHVDAFERELIQADFKPVKDAKVAEWSVNFDIVIGQTPADRDDDRRK